MKFLNVILILNIIVIYHLVGKLKAFNNQKISGDEFLVEKKSPSNATRL